jgi:gas vesicle protein
MSVGQQWPARQNLLIYYVDTTQDIPKMPQNKRGWMLVDCFKRNEFLGLDYILICVWDGKKSIYYKIKDPKTNLPWTRVLTILNTLKHRIDSDSIEKAVEDITDDVTDFAKDLGHDFENIGKDLGNQMESIGTEISQGIDNIGNELENIGQDILDEIKRDTEAVEGLYNQVADEMTDMTTSAVDKVQGVLSDAAADLEVIQQVWDSLPQETKDKILHGVISNVLEYGEEYAINACCIATAETLVGCPVCYVAITLAVDEIEKLSEKYVHA